jgi:hypothetical protein
MTRYQFVMLVGLLCIASLLALNIAFPEQKNVMVLSTFEMEDELGKEWFIIEYLVNGHVEQVNCNSFEQSQEVRKYLGVK